MERIVYMDNAATTPVDAAVLDEMKPFFTEQFANPMTYAHSSSGDVAHVAVEEARVRVASLIGSQPEQVMFTSGGTESDNWVLKGTVERASRERLHKSGHLVTAEFEHHAILHSALALQRQGYEVTFVKVGHSGIVDPDDVQRAMRPTTALVSIMHANNEIGTIQPIADIARIAHEHGALMHTDAVQTTAHIPVDVDTLGVDFLSVSAHKFNGPKGVGILFVRDQEALYPFIDGGGQEWGLRGSTHNVPGIVGLGKAAQLGKERLPRELERLTMLRDMLLSKLSAQIDGIVVNGDMKQRVPQNLNIRIEGIDNEPLLLAMNEAGIIAAGGSACNALETLASHVLTSIGCDLKEAKSSIRLSLGYATTTEDVNYAIDVIPGLVKFLRSMA
ncbi:MAG: cysteine desulfurase family protein [Caldiserica bacterium]|nr:cysteine desulfurase family protein [Caldisericota bacterium]